MNKRGRSDEGVHGVPGDVLTPQVADEAAPAIRRDFVNGDYSA